MGVTERQQQQERYAKCYDRDIAPIWTEPFTSFLLEGISVKEDAQILELACATGSLTERLLPRLRTGRVLAIDNRSLLLDRARRKLGSAVGKHVFLSSNALLQISKFAPTVFDLSLCNIELLSMGEPIHILHHLARITKPGGSVVGTLPIYGSFFECFDMLQEVLATRHHDGGIDSVEVYKDRQPETIDIDRWLTHAGYEEVTVSKKTFKLLFRSGFEFLKSPIIELELLPGWLSFLRRHVDKIDDIFLELEKRIDQYFKGHPFELTVHMGRFQGRRPKNFKLSRFDDESLPTQEFNRRKSRESTVAQQGKTSTSQLIEPTNKSISDHDA